VALTRVVDSSVLTRLHEPAVRAVVEPMLTDGELARAGISDLELGYSARSGAEWDRLTRWRRSS
jgi:predicted nucleic acid-binding protein